MSIWICHRRVDFLRKRFPNIIGHCEALCVDLSTGLNQPYPLRIPLRRDFDGYERKHVG